MDLFNKFKDLVKESLLCKSFKGLTVAKRVLCIIALAPFIAAYVCMLLLYWALVVTYRFASNQLEYIHAFIIKERAEVRHATEAVVYFIAFPFIFTLKVLVGLLAGAVMIWHFVSSMVGYIATFGGIKFSPFVLDNVNRFSNRDAVKHNKGAVITFIIIALVLLVLAIALVPVVTAIYNNWLVTVANGTKDSKVLATLAYEAALFAYRMSIVDIALKATYALFVIIFVSAYSNAGLRKKYIVNLSPEPVAEAAE